MKSVQGFLEDEDTMGVCELALPKPFTKKFHTRAPRKAGQPTDKQARGRGRAGVCSEEQDHGLPQEKDLSGPQRGQESLWGYTGPENIKGPGRDHLGAAGGRLLSHGAGRAKHCPLWTQLPAFWKQRGPFQPSRPISAPMMGASLISGSLGCPRRVLSEAAVINSGLATEPL